FRAKTICSSVNRDFFIGTTSVQGSVYHAGILFLNGTGFWVRVTPGFVSSVSGKEIPGFIFDATGSFGSEILGGYVKDAVNGSQPSSERQKEIKE
ncbi:hypothetical protein SAN18_06525, partial [Raoultella planticola]|nr:hypothetical protein [Raoultella planticola]MDZ7447378.1 hypothetical protein [Raoultella planticola]MDZ7465678.1 hypothetical protein [Raoultella planticola]MDZ7507503.1 hypothetical protein [Raoultella planticola]MEA5395710.1 hypothetical protein [Raoultella planticola]